MIDIAGKLKALRKESQFKQKDVAAGIGIARNTLSQFENNLGRPSYEVLVKIADFFDVTTDYLLGRTDYQ